MNTSLTNQDDITIVDDETFYVSIVNEVTDAIKSSKIIDDNYFAQLLAKYKNHVSQHHTTSMAQNHSHGSTSEHVDHLTDATDTSSTTIEAIGNLSTLPLHVSNFLDKLGPVGSMIANSIELFFIPWKCYQDKRWPTKDEMIKIGICIAGIICMAFALAFPVAAAGLAVVAGVGIMVKNIINVKKEYNELDHLHEQAAKQLKEIERLTNELRHGQSSLNDDNYAKKVSTLRALEIEYIKTGQAIHQIRQKIDHPTKKLTKFKTAMSSLCVIGLITAIFVPPIGIGLVIGASAVSLAVSGIFSASGWLTRPKVPNRNTNSSHTTGTHQTTAALQSASNPHMALGQKPSAGTQHHRNKAEAKLPVAHSQVFHPSSTALSHARAVPYGMPAKRVMTAAQCEAEESRIKALLTREKAAPKIASLKKALGVNDRKTEDDKPFM